MDWIVDSKVSEKVVGPSGSNSSDPQLKIWIGATLGVVLLPLRQILFNDSDNNLEERRMHDHQTDMGARCPSSCKALQSSTKGQKASGGIYYFHA